MLAVTSVVTRKSLGEFLLLKMSFEQYHSARWYLSVDRYAREALQIFDNVTLLETVKSDEGSHGSTDEQRNRVHLEMMMTKFDALRAAIGECGYGLFLDADIFFTAPLEDRVVRLIENPAVDAVLSLHMTNNAQLEGQVGYYNGGFFALRSTKLLDELVAVSWKHRELGLYYEQQPLQFVSYPYLTVSLPINYNIGWWRFNEVPTRSRLAQLRTDGNQLWFGDRPAVCFHAHTLKNLEYENFGKFLVDKVLDLMKASTANSRYQELVQFIENYRPPGSGTSQA